MFIAISGWKLKMGAYCLRGFLKNVQVFHPGFGVFFRETLGFNSLKLSATCELLS